MYCFNIKLYADTSELENLPIRSLSIKQEELELFKKYKIYDKSEYNNILKQLGFEYAKRHNYKFFMDDGYFIAFYGDNKEYIHKSFSDLENELDIHPVLTDCLKLGCIYDWYILLDEDKAKELNKIFDYTDIYDYTANQDTIRKIMELTGINSTYYNTFNKSVNFLMKIKLV